MSRLPISMWFVRLLINQSLLNNDEHVECFRITDCKSNVTALDSITHSLINLTITCTSSTATNHCKISELIHNGSSICCPVINKWNVYTEEIFPCNEEDTYCSISTHGTPKQEYNKCEFTVYDVDIRGTFNIGFIKYFFFFRLMNLLIYFDIELGFPHSIKYRPKWNMEKTTLDCLIWKIWIIL